MSTSIISGLEMDLFLLRELNDKQTDRIKTLQRMKDQKDQEVWWLRNQLTEAREKLVKISETASVAFDKYNVGQNGIDREFNEFLGKKGKGEGSK